MHTLGAFLPFDFMGQNHLLEDGLYGPYNTGFI